MWVVVQLRKSSESTKEERRERDGAREEQGDQEIEGVERRLV